MTVYESMKTAKRITKEDGQYFFGYYDKEQWNESGQLMVGCRADFMGRDPDGTEPLEIGVIDTRNNYGFTVVGETVAWNWQQGCLLRWMPGAAGDLITFNVYKDGDYRAAVYNTKTGDTKLHERPFYDITSDGMTAVCGNFARVNDTRPGYGYFCMPDPFSEELNPDDDGLYAIHVKSDESRLVFTLQDALHVGKIRPDEGNKAWFNHMTYNPSGTRMLVFHRWAPHAVPGHSGFKSRVITINSDGTEPAAVLEGLKISHYSWLDDERILFWLEKPEENIHGYYIVHDPSGEIEPVSEGVFPIDGHCNLSACKKWMVTDMYPKNEQVQPLFLYEMATGRAIKIGQYHAMLDMNTSYRCDLHTRWDRTTTKLCFDSTHEGSRAMYVVEVADITKGGK